MRGSEDGCHRIISSPRNSSPGYHESKRDGVASGGGRGASHFLRGVLAAPLLPLTFPPRPLWGLLLERKPSCSPHVSPWPFLGTRRLALLKLMRGWPTRCAAKSRSAPPARCMLGDTRHWHRHCSSGGRGVGSAPLAVLNCAARATSSST